MTLLQVQPHTGRTHQIRRHLAYCLGWPIVGDAKYDKGHSAAKILRTNGMYLCCHSLEFPYPLNDNDLLPARVAASCGCGDNGTIKLRVFPDSSRQQGGLRLRAEIPLPPKFMERLKEHEL
eukprot:CAMPEP_0168719084 /NCGR_PEP_ID=MMETSP0724-20121128/854_1 /TAXON_ID=265536 /ORGANISM="Amphiprora sp., Strain CCMP467" /LENGTH=120 /DNA_ID=CAMNT_0008765623 /DNA_START=117 /DNA_END=479 /DNA_ORIENTATION=+